MRRLLTFLEVFQLMLCEKNGLPLSRLLSLKETDTRFSKRRELKRLQEESASQKLHGKRVKVEEKEDESGPRQEILSSSSTNSTLKNFPTEAKPPSTQPLPHDPCLPSSPASPPLFTPPPFTPPWIPFHQFGQMPAVNWVICGGCQMWGTVVPFSLPSS